MGVATVRMELHRFSLFAEFVSQNSLIGVHGVINRLYCTFFFCHGKTEVELTLMIKY